MRIFLITTLAITILSTMDADLCCDARVLVSFCEQSSGLCSFERVVVTLSVTLLFLKTSTLDEFKGEFLIVDIGSIKS